MSMNQAPKLLSHVSAADDHKVNEPSKAFVVAPREAAFLATCSGSEPSWAG